eukprot:TRINITY_DN6787_c0_g1_i1.p1 TRINITY_DN6787_c0_g1~~TRINITY_DN6787_c0_g1_i1.p1  ORF type:complete len:459 (+),score=76.53 TRINITY_DN6787_c0_g1_i1:1691-3067(+)
MMDWRLVLVIFHSGMLFLLVTIYRQTVENDKVTLKLFHAFDTLNTNIQEIQKENSNVMLNLNGIAKKVDSISVLMGELSEQVLKKGDKASTFQETITNSNTNQQIDNIHTTLQNIGNQLNSIDERMKTIGAKTDGDQTQTFSGQLDKIVGMSEKVNQIGSLSEEIRRVAQATNELRGNVEKTTSTIKEHIDPLFILNHKMTNMISAKFESLHTLKPQNLNTTAKRVVFGVTAEDLHWTFEIDQDIDIVVYTHEFRNFDTRGRVVLNVPNTGRESGNYLKHIVDYYNDLADVTLFIHGQGSSWHTKNAPVVINNLRWTEIQDYQPLHHHYYWKNDNKITQQYGVHKELQYIWKDYFLKEMKFELPNEIIHTCCGEFAISRETIRSHPIEFYQALYEYITIIRSDDPWLMGHMMEIVWHIIFYKPAIYSANLLDFCGKVAYCDKLPADIVKLHTNPIYSS